VKSVKTIKIGILVSIGIHFLALLIFILIDIDHVPIHETVEIGFQALPQLTIETKEQEARPATQQPMPPKPVLEPPEPIAPKPPDHFEEVVLVDSTDIDSTESLRAKDILFETLSFRVKKALLEFPIPDLLLRQVDTTKQICVLMPLQDASQFGDPSVWNDRVADDIRQRNLGGQPPISLTNLIAAGVALLTKGLIGDKLEKKAKLTFIPSKSELDVLNFVWAKEKATQLDIYSSLDTSNTLSAVELDDVLERMVSKRLLKREIISPQCLMKIPLPIGTFFVEEKLQNMLNRIYLYESIVDREEMMRFLNAVLYQVQSGSEISFTNVTDSTALRKSLIHKIGRIVSGK
jgi:hypothetical protein